MTTNIEFPIIKGKIRDGMQIEATHDGIRFIATIVHDTDAGAPDKEIDGFWPSKDPKDNGYIGEEPTVPFEKQADDARKVMNSYKRGGMVWAGVCVQAFTGRKGDIELTGQYDYALWCIDTNWPGSDNAYLSNVASDLASECLAAAVARREEIHAGFEGGKA
jgi:hypothetical protein